MSRTLLLCPRWRKGDFRPVPVQPVITGQDWAGPGRGRPVGPDGTPWPCRRSGS